MEDKYEQVEVYGLRHAIGGPTHLFLGKKDKFYQFEVSLEEARLLVDILRNEKPIYLNPAKKLITTSSEPVGEGEAGA